MASLEQEWGLLLQQAIRGTDRAEGNQTPQELLRRVSRLALQRKAGFPLPLFNGVLPDPVDAAPMKVCSPEATAYMHRMLNGQFQKALPEFIQWLGQTRQELPPTTLPGILDACLKNEELWNLTSPLLAGRGLWLAAQHVEWSQLLIDRPDPQTLVVVWEGLKADEKLALIQQISPPFLSADLDWLKMGLQDRSERVQIAVTKALLSLPESSWGTAAFEWLELLLNHGSAPLPEPITGLQKQHDDPEQLGKEIIRMINPERVIEAFQAAEKSLPELPAPWLESLLLAALDYQSASVIEDLLVFYLQGGSSLSAMPKQVPLAANRLSRAQFNSHLMAALKARKGMLSERDPAYQLLLRCDQAWDDELTKLLLDPLKEKLRIYQDTQWQHIHYRKLLEVAAYKIRPRYLSTLLADWPAMGYRQMEWIEALEIVENVVAFRIGFIEALRKVND